MTAQANLGVARDLLSRIQSDGEAQVLDLGKDFDRMNLECAELLKRYNVQDRDRTILKKLEAVRVKRARSLRLVQRGFRFDFDVTVKDYSTIFRDELGIDTDQKPFDLEAQAVMLLSRPARPQYSVVAVHGPGDRASWFL